MKHQQLFKSVEPLYLASERKFAQWGWKAHVQVVADFAQKLAKKYNADEDICVCAALLHDIGDTKFDRGEENDEFSEKIAQEFLAEVGYKQEETEKIFTQVIEPHSCHQGNKPDNIEGKVMASADALAHLSTDFYLHMLWMNLPNGSSYEEWVDWLLKKIDRDFHDKMFFEDEKESVRANYEALKLLFGKKEIPE